MNEKQREFLKDKITKMQSYLDETTEKKRASTSGFNYEIKATKKRMSTYALVCKDSDETRLADVMTETEFQEFSRLKP